MPKPATETSLKETTFKKIVNIENLLVTLSEDILREIQYQNSVLLVLGNAICAIILLSVVTQQKGIPSFHLCPYSCF